MATLLPRNTAMCCTFLRLKEGSAVHQAMVRAIIQVTGYGKKHLKADGKIEPRNPDGSFTIGFEDLVRRFLVDMKGGVIFFFEVPPWYDGWKSSFVPNKQLLWNIKGDREGITFGTQLLFENVRANPKAMNIDSAEILESFVGDDCDVCGGGDGTEANNDIVYCDWCKRGFHQLCCNLPVIPAGEWYCANCITGRTTRKRQREEYEATLQTEPNKAAKHGNAFLRGDRLNNPKSSGSAGTFRRGGDSGPRVKVEKGIRRSSLGFPPDRHNAQVTLARRNASMLNVPIGPSTPRIDTGKNRPRGMSDVENNPISSFQAPRADMTNIRVNPVKVDVPEISVDIGSMAGSMAPLKQAPTSSRPDNVAAAPENIRAAAPPVSLVRPYLTKEQIDGTMFRVRLNNEKIYRLLPLQNVADGRELFMKSFQRWPDSGDPDPRLLAYLPFKADGVTEIQKNSRRDFSEFIRLIKMEWDIMGAVVPERIYVDIVLLTDGQELRL